MNEKIQDREQLLSMLTEAVSLVTNFFTQTDGALFDGHQTARQVLSHLVFWHREYVAISHALLIGAKPVLLRGSLAELNDQASIEFQEQDMVELVHYLTELQTNLVTNLRCLEDWDVNFPFKKGCRETSVGGRICAIDAHIRNHLARQERASRRGEAWIKAYYPD
ncbi:MAG: hypothetical protein GWP61_20955 [Chloroflexi bacterium]|jgi:hypothetical protein|nr:hypothetical protein [Chloroflexota bacterium]